MATAQQGAAFASSIACRREPGPALLVFVTVNDPAKAGALAGPAARAAQASAASAGSNASLTRRDPPARPTRLSEHEDGSCGRFMADLRCYGDAGRDVVLDRQICAPRRKGYPDS